MNVFTLHELYKEIRFFLRSQKVRYVPYWKIPGILVKNASHKYSFASFEQLKKYKKSDTIFVVGSGPSAGELSKKQWEYINSCDSFGINFSYLLDFKPTYYSMEDGKISWYRNFIEEVFKPYREKMSDTVWFVSQRHLYRLIHPKLTPKFFPERPVCYYYRYPKAIELKEDRSFEKEDFQKNTLVYRGSLSVVLHLISKLNYKNIVLVGVDLNSSAHFFDKYDFMRPCIEKNIEDVNDYAKKGVIDEGYDKTKYETMIPKGKKYRTAEEYLYALSELYFKDRNINLYVADETSILSPRIKPFNWNMPNKN